MQHICSLMDILFIDFKENPLMGWKEMDELKSRMNSNVLLDK